MRSDPASPGVSAAAGLPSVASAEEEEAAGLATGHGYVDTLDAPVAAQTWWIYRNLRRVLEAQGSALGQALRFHIYQKDKRFFAYVHTIDPHVVGGLKLQVGDVIIDGTLKTALQKLPEEWMEAIIR